MILQKIVYVVFFSSWEAKFDDKIEILFFMLYNKALQITEVSCERENRFQ